MTSHVNRAVMHGSLLLARRHVTHVVVHGSLLHHVALGLVTRAHLLLLFAHALQVQLTLVLQVLELLLTQYFQLLCL